MDDGSALDAFAFSAAFQTAVRVVFVTAAVALVFNRWVRASAFVLGA